MPLKKTLKSSKEFIKLKLDEISGGISEESKISDFFGVLIDINSDEIIKIIKESHTITSKNHQQTPNEHKSQPRQI
jgi:hypothetical protein